MPNSVEEVKTVGDTELFYHALYHHVAHWAAYIAMLGILITIALLLSLSPVESGSNRLVRVLGTGWAIFSASLGASYFINGMRKYGQILNERLPPAYLKSVLFHSHKLITCGQIIAAVLCAAVDAGILLALSRCTE